MRSTRRLTTIAALILMVFFFSACAERLAEFGLERAIEASAEGDVDIDLDLNGGNISVSGSENGEEFSFNLDAEDGTFAFEGPEGEEGTVEFSQDGIQFDSTEGSGTIEFDQENGQVNFDTDEGSGSLNFDEDGLRVVDEAGNETFSIEEDNGITRFESADGVVLSSTQPLDGWPALIGVPNTLDTTNSNFSSLMGTDGNTTWNGILSFDTSEDFVGALTSRLEQAGYTQVQSADFGEGGNAFWENGDQQFTMQWSPGTVIVALLG